jgi:hypothetical protein
MKKIFVIVLSFFLLNSCDSNPSKENLDNLSTQEKVIANTHPIPKKFRGKFFCEVETESTSTGMAYISYYFDIQKTGIQLELNTYHEPIRCEGAYQGFVKNNILELYYDGMDESCQAKSYSFALKKVGNKLFILGVGSIATESEWIELKKDKS